MVAHGLVHAQDFHDGDDPAHRRAAGDREISSHLAVAQLHFDVPCLHALDLAFAAGSAPSLRRSRALPAKMRSRSWREISSASTAAMVSRMRPLPCSASNGASVANRENAMPKTSVRSG